MTTIGLGTTTSGRGGEVRQGRTNYEHFIHYHEEDKACNQRGPRKIKMKVYV